MKKITKKVVDDYISGSIDGTVVTGAPANLVQIHDFEMEMSVELPDDLINLYQIYNGIGLISKSGATYWSFHPIDGIAEFIKNIRNYFSDTHPEEAIRFFPIYDWNSGDAIGYMRGREGGWEEGLFEFEHENYEFKESQPASEFLSRCNRDLMELLME